MAKRPRKSDPSLPALRDIERAIYLVRGQRVMLDSDLAALYGVTTAALNQAVKRQARRFPSDFSFLLTLQEFKDWISQSVISNTVRGGRRTPPRAFTEQGVAMLSSVLRSSIAIDVNVAIMRTFVRVRRLMVMPGELVEQLTKLAETVRLHDHQIQAIADVLQRMTDHPAAPKRRIGFHADGKAE